MIVGVRNTVIAVILMLAVNLPGELLKTSKLRSSAAEAKVKRDIFRFGNSAPPPVINRAKLEEERKEREQKAQEEAQAEETLQEAATVVVYEGYVADDGKVTALISIDGEYYVVCENEKILDEVEVVKITAAVITLQVKNKKMEIEFKGGDEK